MLLTVKSHEPGKDYVCFQKLGKVFFFQTKHLMSISSHLGISAAPLWTAQASYTTTIATRYAESAGLNQETVISKFFCIFYVMFQLGQVTGNIISSVVLKQTGLRASLFDGVFEQF